MALHTLMQVLLLPCPPSLDSHDSKVRRSEKKREFEGVKWVLKQRKKKSIYIYIHDVMLKSLLKIFFKQSILGLRLLLPWKEKKSLKRIEWFRENKWKNGRILFLCVERKSFHYYPFITLLPRLIWSAKWIKTKAQWVNNVVENVKTIYIFGS